MDNKTYKIVYSNNGKINEKKHGDKSDIKLLLNSAQITIISITLNIG